MPESPKDLHRYLQAARDALLWKLDGHAGTGVRGRGLAQIDARDATARTDSCYEVGRFAPVPQPTSSTWSPGRSRRRRTTPGQSWRVHRCAHGPHVDDPPPHPSALLPKGQPKFELDVVGVT